MEKTLVPGKTYTVTTASECSVTDSNGLVLCTASAGEQKAFVATTTTITFSDDSATVTAVFKGAPALGGSGGSGGGSGTPGTPAGFGAVTATATSLAAGSTPTAAVETSGFNTAKNFAFSFGIPQGEKGEKGDKGDSGLTSEQIELLTTYAASEGQNVSIGTDGTFSTLVGHTYVVTAESAVTVTQGDVTLNISAGSQQGFVATGSTATVSPTTCTVTEVFRAAATVALGGTSGGEEEEVLPSGYQRALFIQNTGEQQFITDYTEENITAFDVDYKPVALTSQYSTPFSNYFNEEKSCTRVLLDTSGYASFYIRGRGGNSSTESHPIRDDAVVRSIPQDAQLARSYVKMTAPVALYGGRWFKRKTTFITSTNDYTISIFAGSRESGTHTSSIYRLFRLTFFEGENIGFDVVPCLKNGVPCFYNLITGVDYFADGEVAPVVGLTVEQARKLGSLPSGGGALTVGIPGLFVDPDGQVTDSGIVAALEVARNNGWTITIQTY